jgi:predicted nucleic acid-binding protein
MKFLDTDILSFYFRGNIIIKDNIMECIKNNGTLVTNNIKHYESIKNLDLVNWL